MSIGRVRLPAPGMSVSMQVWSASVAAPDRLANEDHAFRFGPLVGVLDGATVPEGFETGCVHGPAWYVQRLAARLAVADADRPVAALAGNLAAAILAVRADHDGRCDLDHPGTPSATVCLLRHSGDRVDYLVLCDSPLVIDCGGQVRVISDDRLATAAAEIRATAAAATSTGGRTDPAASFQRAVTLQRRLMNQTPGYWVAAADPDAAFHAVTGSLPLHGPDRIRRAALLSDGASRAVEEFGLCDWRGLLDLVTERGPEELIRRVRRAEYAGAATSASHAPRFKRHDDATATLCVFTPEQRPEQPGRPGQSAGPARPDGGGPDEEGPDRGGVDRGGVDRPEEPDGGGPGRAGGEDFGS